MKIETKYNPGQKAFILRDSDLLEVLISRIYTETRQDNEPLVTYEIIKSEKELKFFLDYDYQNRITFDFARSIDNWPESHVFASPEEALTSIYRKFQQDFPASLYSQKNIYINNE